MYFRPASGLTLYVPFARRFTYGLYSGLMSTALPRLWFDSFFDPATMRKLKHEVLFLFIDSMSLALKSSMSCIRSMGYFASKSCRNMLINSLATSLWQIISPSFIRPSCV